MCRLVTVKLLLVICGLWFKGKTKEKLLNKLEHWFWGLQKLNQRSSEYFLCLPAFSWEYSVHLSWWWPCVLDWVFRQEALHNTRAWTRGFHFWLPINLRPLWCEPESVQEEKISSSWGQHWAFASWYTQDKYTAAFYQSQQNVNTQHIARVFSTGSVCVLLVEIRCQQSVCVSSQWTFWGRRQPTTSHERWQLEEELGRIWYKHECFASCNFATVSPR